MGIAETLFLYLLIGVVVAVAHALTAREAQPGRLALTFVTTVPFWPIFAPFLLARPAHRARQRVSSDPAVDGRILAAETRLLAALESLDGIAEEILAPEVERVHGLGEALRTMSRRAAEMSTLLGTPEFSRERASQALERLEADTREAHDPRIESIRARLTNIDRLETMQKRTLDALERALLEVEEIGSRTALLKFADHPEEEVVRMIREIASSVEGVSDGLLIRN